MQKYTTPCECDLFLQDMKDDGTLECDHAVWKRKRVPWEFQEYKKKFKVAQFCTELMNSAVKIADHNNIEHTNYKTLYLDTMLELGNKLTALRQENEALKAGQLPLSTDESQLPPEKREEFKNLPESDGF